MGKLGDLKQRPNRHQGAGERTRGGGRPERKRHLDVEKVAINEKVPITRVGTEGRRVLEQCAAVRHLVGHDKV